MNFKFPKLIYVVSVVFAGWLLIGYPQQAIGSETVDIEQLQSNDVIYLGENHDNPTHHQQQLDIIQKLHGGREGKNLAIALEMFQRPFQPILDRYIAREISETQLQKQTEYDTRWGFDWEFYAPILRYARQEGIALIALNTPAEITLKVAETGIDSLEGSDFRYVPPRHEIKLDDREYKQNIAKIYSQHVAEGQGNSQDLDNFFAAQVLWDETMAEAIALHHQHRPQSQLIVLVGKAHVMYDYAIPNRVKRRIRDKSFQDTVQLL